MQCELFDRNGLPLNISAIESTASELVTKRKKTAVENINVNRAKSTLSKKNNNKSFDGVSKTKEIIDCTDLTGLNLLRESFLSTPEFIQKMNLIMDKKLLFIPQHFTLTQKRIIAYAIGLISNEQRDMCSDEFVKHKFTIHAKYFKDAFQIRESTKGELYNLLKDAADAFMREIGVLKLNNNNNISKFVWVQQVNYVENEGKIELYFSSLITDFLINFSNSHKKTYVNYNLFVSHALRSQHAIRLYELLQTRQDTNTVVLGFNEFKNIMGINPISAPYQVREKVLGRAKKELNEKLELGFDFSIDKHGGYDGGYKVILTAKLNNRDIMHMFNMEKYEARKRLSMKST